MSLQLSACQRRERASVCVRVCVFEVNLTIACSQHSLETPVFLVPLSSLYICKAEYSSHPGHPHHRHHHHRSETADWALTHFRCLRPAGLDVISFKGNCALASQRLKSESSCCFPSSLSRRAFCSGPSSHTPLCTLHC